MANNTENKTASWGVITMLAAAQFIMVLDTTVMNESITQVAADLNTTIVGLQMAVSKLSKSLFSTLRYMPLFIASKVMSSN